MDMNQVARDNHAFYYLAVGFEIGSELFAQAVSHSFDEPALYSVLDEDYSGYINVDSTDIERNRTRGGFMDEVREGILGTVGMRILSCITGELNTEVEIIEGIYKFTFTISKYERDGEHRFEPVDDPNSLPDGEKIGRFCDLKITIVE